MTIQISRWANAGEDGADIYRDGRLAGTIIEDEVEGGYEVTYIDETPATTHPSYRAAETAARKALAPAPADSPVDKAAKADKAARSAAADIATTILGALGDADSFDRAMELMKDLDRAMRTAETANCELFAARLGYTS